VPPSAAAPAAAVGAAAGVEDVAPAELLQ
jgi:hypothetical protein